MQTKRFASRLALPAIVAVGLLGGLTSSAGAAWTKPSDIGATKVTRAEGTGGGVVAVTDTAVAWRDTTRGFGLRLTSRSGSGWRRPTFISSVEDAAAATSDDGGVTVVYERRTGADSGSPRGGKGARASRAAATRYAVWVVSAKPGGAWSKPVRLSPKADRICGLPTVARTHGSPGVIVAQWTCYTGQQRAVVMASIYRDGAWTRPSVIADQRKRLQDPGAAATVDERGTATVVWSDWGPQGISLQTRSWVAGAWTPTSTIAVGPWQGDPDDGDAYNLLVPTHLAPTTDAAGALLVPMFRRPSPTTSDLEVAVLGGPRDAWTPPAILASNPDRDPTYVQLGPRIGGSAIRLAADNTGRVVAVWADMLAGSATKTLTLMLSERTRDGVWSGPRSIGTPRHCAGCKSSNFALAGNGRGDIVLMWPQSIPGGSSEPRYALTAITRTPDGVWAQPEAIAKVGGWEVQTDNTRTGSATPLFVDEQGQATLAWLSCRNLSKTTGRPANGCVVTESTRTPN